jgi:hypothetical protein
MGCLIMSDWPVAFFATPNQLDLAAISHSNVEEGVNKLFFELIESATLGHLPIILPRLSLKGGYSFYICTDGIHQLGELRQIVLAYFGNTYFEPCRQIFETSKDPLESTLLAKYPTGFLLLKVRECFQSDQMAIMKLTRTLTELLKRFRDKPLFISDVKRPTARILRDFFIAIKHFDGDSALTYVTELSNRRLLTPINLISLKLQAFDSANRWDDILSDKKVVNDVVTGISSSHVTLIILRALRNTILSSDVIQRKRCDEIASELDGIQAIFLKDPEIAISAEEEWMSWSIGAAVFGYDQLEHALPEGLTDKGWWNTLSEWLSGNLLPILKPVTIELEVLMEEVPSRDAAGRLLSHSVLENTNGQRQIYDLLKGYPAGIIEAVIEENVMFRLLLDNLRRCSDQLFFRNWQDVFIAIRGDASIVTIQEVLNKCVNDWGRESWDEVHLSLFIETGEGSLLRDILPHLLPWLVESEIALSKINILGILENLAADETVSAQDLNLCSDLFGIYSALPTDPREYLEVLDCVDLIWEKVKSRSTINYYLDVLDLIVDAPCGDSKRREDLWSSFQKYLILQWPKLDEAQILTAVQLAKDLTGTSEQFVSVYAEKAVVDDVPNIDLSGKTLAIYSLTEGAGQRAKSIISRKYPGVVVSLNHDKTATSSLINLAEKVDYFIFVSRSAAHQAFYPVTDKRKDLIYPSGKGSSSIVRAFDERIQVAL